MNAFTRACVRAWNRFLRIAFVALVGYPIVLVVLGLNVRHRSRLPLNGPAVVAANHNSHLDTLTLLSLFPLSVVHRVRPVAAADYFLSSGLMAWFSLNVIGIIPVVRKRDDPNYDPLTGCYEALEQGDILLIFPEGTRGEPEKMQQLKSGISFIAAKFPDVPTVPIFMHGLGKSMPKGASLPVPFFVDVFIGRPFTWNEGGAEKKAFMAELEARMLKQREKVQLPEYH
jgi:1-acyl-sn-glycerol-3-phosphate acyltransferase